VKDELVVSLSQVYVNPYSKKAVFIGNLDASEEPIDGPIYTWSEFERKLVLGRDENDVDVEKRNQMKALHLLRPALKAKALKQMGVKPKTSDMPDWQRRALAGMDERKT
jgi:hypothetical protein